MTKKLVGTRVPLISRAALTFGTFDLSLFLGSQLYKLASVSSRSEKYGENDE